MKRKFQIFTSSTYEDLKMERRKVQDAILQMHHFPIGMEMFSAADEDQWEIIKRTIDESDYYILIICHRYGSTFKSGKDKGMSYTEKEYRYASEKSISLYGNTLIALNNFGHALKTILDKGINVNLLTMDILDKNYERNCIFFGSDVERMKNNSRSAFFRMKELGLC